MQRSCPPLGLTDFHLYYNTVQTLAYPRAGTKEHSWIKCDPRLGCTRAIFERVVHDRTERQTVEDLKRGWQIEGPSSVLDALG